MRLRIGEILVKRGVMTPRQCEQVLEAQRTRRRPFGALAEELFNVSPDALRSAWAEQYELMVEKVDPRKSPVSDAAIKLISRRQAWQFRMLPLQLDGGELSICTTRQHLARALTFAYRQLGPSCSFVLAEPEHLGQALQKHYPWAASIDQRLTPDLVGSGSNE